MTWVSATCEALLRAIDAEPKDLGLRCIFADALEESATTDGHMAMVEWIRHSCQNLTKTGRMHRTAFEWLHANWERLVPAARAAHKPESPEHDTGPDERRFFSSANVLQNEPTTPENPYKVHYWKSARQLVTHWNLVPPGWSPGAKPYYSYRVNLHFGRGFLDEFEARNTQAQRQLYHLVLVDQPLCKIGGLNAEGRRQAERLLSVLE